MITPEFLESCPDRLEQLYAQAEADIIADMARKLQKYDYYSSAVEWQALKLKEMGLSQKEIYDRLSKASGKTKTAIKNLMKQAGATVLADDGLRPTEATINALNVGLQKTMGSFENLTRSTATQGTNQLVEMMDRAYMQVTSGAFSPDQAIKNAVEQLAKEGIRSYDYGTRVDHIDVVVRRAVRTGINQTAGLISLNNADELGTDLVEVTAHSGARPSHAEWQGKVYSISGKTKGYQKLDEATGYGSVTGLMGANCRHSFHPFFEGDERTYSDEELAHIDDKKYTYNGKQMSEYEATQKQRYIERQIRRWKREEAGMAAIGESTEEAKAKIKEWQKTQADFITQTGLKRQYAREQIPTGKTILPTIEKSNTGANTASNKFIIKEGSLPPTTYEFKYYDKYAEARNAWREAHPNEDVYDFFVDDSKFNGYANEPELLDRIKRFDATIHKLEKESPISPKYGDHVIVGTFKGVEYDLTDIQRERMNPEEMSAQAQHWLNMNDNKIVIAYHPEGNINTFEEDLKIRSEKLANGEKLLTVFDNSPEGTAIHEWGHGYSEFITDEMIYDNPSAKEYWEWYKSLSKDDIRYGISEYATENRWEFEAECFSELQTDNPRPIAVKFGEYLEKCRTDALKRIEDFGIEAVREGTATYKSLSAQGDDLIQWLPKGENITSEQYKELRSYAESKGITLSGFKKSDVDIDLVKEYIDEAERMLEKYPKVKSSLNNPFTLRLSPLPANDFANTDPKIHHIINLNRDSMRNTAKLAEEYAKLAEEKWFVKGTDYHSIIPHEFGHIVGDILGVDGSKVMEEIIGVDDVQDVLNFCLIELSEYSGSVADGSEIISEIFSAYEHGDRRDFVLTFMEKCGIL